MGSYRRRCTRARLRPMWPDYVISVQLGPLPMSALRVRTPDGRNLDRDLGPSGHTRNGTGFVFYMLHEQPTASDLSKLKPKPVRVRGNRYGARVMENRCGHALRTGELCARKAGHGNSDHKSRAAMDKALASYRA